MQFTAEYICFSDDNEEPAQKARRYANIIQVGVTQILLKFQPFCTIKFLV